MDPQHSKNQLKDRKNKPFLHYIPKVLIKLNSFFLALEAIKRNFIQKDCFKVVFIEVKEK